MAACGVLIGPENRDGVTTVWVRILCHPPIKYRAEDWRSHRLRIANGIVV